MQSGLNAWLSAQCHAHCLSFNRFVLLNAAIRGATVAVVANKMPCRVGIHVGLAHRKRASARARMERGQASRRALPNSPTRKFSPGPHGSRDASHITWPSRSLLSSWHRTNRRVAHHCHDQGFFASFRLRILGPLRGAPEETEGKKKSRRNSTIVDTCS